MAELSKLPIHLYPLGFRRDGRPIWPIRGASPDGDGGDEGSGGEGGSGESEETGGGDDLAKVQEALRKEREARKQEAKDAKAGREALAKLAEIEEKNKDATQKAIDAAREEARQEERLSGLRERVVDKLEVAIAGMNPVSVRAAVLLLADDADSFISDGQIDTAAIKKAAEQLKEDEPDLFRASGNQQRSGGSFDQGKRGGDDGKPSVSSGAERYKSRTTNRTTT